MNDEGRENVQFSLFNAHLRKMGNVKLKKQKENR